MYTPSICGQNGGARENGIGGGGGVGIGMGVTFASKHHMLACSEAHPNSDADAQASFFVWMLFFCGF